MSWQEHLLSILDPTLTLPVGVVGDADGEPSYELLIWESVDVPKPSEEEFEKAVLEAKALSYRSARRNAYPSIADQLDLLYHGGIDLWREQIASIKDEFPKA